MVRVFPRFPGGKAKCLTLSYDDGVFQDARLAEIMKRYGIAGTFNINSGMYRPEGNTQYAGRRMTLEDSKKIYLDSPLFEVATHALNHHALAVVPACNVVHQIITDRANLEAQYGGVCRGHAYAYGSYSQEVIRLLADCGIAYARTTKSTESFDLPTDWLALHPTCHHKNPRLMELADKFLSEEVRQAPWMFYLWGHTYEFDENDNWQIIEDFCQKVSGHGDVWYATNIAICDYIRDWNRLVWSVDGNTVHNPTAQDLWVCAAPTFRQYVTYHVPAGQTVKLG